MQTINKYNVYQPAVRGGLWCTVTYVQKIYEYISKLY